MLPSLKCQIFRFWSKFVSCTQLSRQQIQFSKLLLCHFLAYMTKHPHAKNFKNPQVGPEENKSQTDRQTDRGTDEQD